MRVKYFEILRTNTYIVNAAFKLCDFKGGIGRIVHRSAFHLSKKIYSSVIGKGTPVIARFTRYQCNFPLGGSRWASTMAPIGSIGKDPNEYVDEILSENKVVIFSKSFCPFCKKVRDILDYERIGYSLIELDFLDEGAAIQQILEERTGLATVPNVFFNGKSLGGFTEVSNLHKEENLLPQLINRTHDYEFDLVVIGGGSGGLAASKEAARYGAKVAVCDFVKPTPIGTTWGLGGTCVNVGCIPKKLMHQTAILGHDIKDSAEFGWNVPEAVSHDWTKMVEAIQNHIGGLNWGYRVALRDKKVDYLNAYAQFIDKNTLKTVNKKGKERIVTAENIMISVGGRPRYPDIPGAKDYCITSDDIFSLSYPPGKTLLVGASYIALECAGFLAGLGFDVTVMVRSILLRGFDQQMANKIGEYMEKDGVKFIRGAVPTSIERVSEGEPGTLKVVATTSEGETIEGEYNTVCLAIGRDPCTQELGLENAGVEVAKSGKIIVDKGEKSSVDNIYALGDVIEGGLELTPVAIQAGKLLARRLYGNRSDLTEYDNVPTTVFTPLEYGVCGMSEENAIDKYGEADIEVYHSNFMPLEFTLPHKPENDCYLKLICVKSKDNLIVGFHYLGPNAGEVTQGFSLGLKLGAKKKDFDRLIGIHPTNAEVFTTVNVTKRSGKDIGVAGC